MKKNRFDYVAPFYDLLSRLIFGKALIKSQAHFLDSIPEGARVLIVGGGTGRLLSHKDLEKASDIDYLELSSAMLSQARQNCPKQLNVNFIEGDFFCHSGSYDVVIANFFLDCFNADHLKAAIAKLSQIVSSKGLLLVTDFMPPDRLKHKVLLRLMLLFFRLSAQLEAKELLNIPEAIEQVFSKKRTELFINGFVFTSIFEPAT
ncbi:class I SAM-dependent methyltransferase [Roseivirga sp.]|uniref:class I SAM-dependent methyltransferase n=1 Tax=Roseivirga sp. TaxID=1964215 RepID=UPI003B52BA42